MGRPTSTEQKLDMALDELVNTDEDIRSSKRSGGYGPAGGNSDGERDGPYASGGGKGRGKGKGKRRLPPEEKALLKTQCFFNSAGELVVKLYDTQVFVLKKAKEAATPKEDATQPEKPEEKSEGGLVLVLTSGGFRTAETKAILNEALQPMAMRIDGSESSRWMLNSDYKTPGQVTDGSSSRPFEDNMEISAPAVVTVDMVRNHMAEKLQAAKAADAQRARQDQGGFQPGPPPPPGSWALAPPPGWGVPPPVWGMPPPGAWRPPVHALPGQHPPHPPHPWVYPAPPPHWPRGPPPLHGPPPPHSGAYGPPPGKGDGKGKAPAQPKATPAPGARPPRPAGPLPDDMFQ